jgi:hypothetical protein
MEHAGEFEYEAQIKIHLCFIKKIQKVIIEIFLYFGLIHKYIPTFSLLKKMKL